MGFKSQTAEVVGNIVVLPARIVEPVMTGFQKVLGIRRMPWVFLLPNLLAVLLFSLLPVVINPCRYWAQPELSEFQAVNNPDRPLIECGRGERD